MHSSILKNSKRRRSSQKQISIKEIIRATTRTTVIRHVEVALLTERTMVDPHLVVSVQILLR